MSSFNDGSTKKKADAWRVVLVGDRSLADIKNAYARNSAQTAKHGILQPEKAFGQQLNLLQTQKEQDAVQIREQERAAMNPPPTWISPEDDADRMQRGEGKLHPDLEDTLMKLENSAPEELQFAMKKLLDGVRTKEPWTEAIALSPEPLSRIAKSWWRWFFKSSLPPPLGSWMLDKGIVPALAQVCPKGRRRRESIFRFLFALSRSRRCCGRS